MAEPGAEPFRVLIGIDTSEHADYAFDYYVKNLHRDGNEVILLHVAELPSSSTLYMSGGVWEEVVQRERDRTTVLEKEYKEKLEKLGIGGRIVATFGHKPGEMVVETAEKEKANLVVLGTRGQGKVRRTILGSVSDYIIHHAHCPVVVCRQEHQHHHHHHHHHFGFHFGHHKHDKDKHEGEKIIEEQIDPKSSN